MSMYARFLAVDVCRPPILVRMASYRVVAEEKRCACMIARDRLRVE